MRVSCACRNIQKQKKNTFQNVMPLNLCGPVRPNGLNIPKSSSGQITKHVKITSALVMLRLDALHAAY